MKHDYTRRATLAQKKELINPSITPRLKSRGINKGHTEPPPLIRTINGTVLRRECIKRYKEGYRKKPEHMQELKAIEKVEIETLTKEHWDRLRNKY